MSGAPCRPTSRAAQRPPQRPSTETRRSRSAQGSRGRLPWASGKCKDGREGGAKQGHTFKHGDTGLRVVAHSLGEDERQKLRKDDADLTSGNRSNKSFTPPLPPFLHTHTHTTSTPPTTPPPLTRHLPMHETHARAIELVGHHLPEERRHSLAHRPRCRIAEEIEKVDERTCRVIAERRIGEWVEESSNK